MKQLLQHVRTFVLMASVATVLASCAPQQRHDQNVTAARDDIHEKLSAVITRDGFTHGLRSQRDGWQHFDSIYVRIALDALKRRHYTLDNLMKDIGRTCALPNYSHLAIRIEIGAGDEADREYLSSMLMPAIQGKPNITVIAAPDIYNDITIAVSHPGQANR